MDLYSIHLKYDQLEPQMFPNKKSSTRVFVSNRFWSPLFLGLVPNNELDVQGHLQALRQREVAAPGERQVWADAHVASDIQLARALWERACGAELPELVRSLRGLLAVSNGSKHPFGRPGKQASDKQASDASGEATPVLEKKRDKKDKKHRKNDISKKSKKHGRKHERRRSRSNSQ